MNEQILSNGLEECLEKGARSCGWEKKRVMPPGNGIIKKGIGLSIMMHGTGAARALPDPASATIMMNSDGTATCIRQQQTSARAIGRFWPRLQQKCWALTLKTSQCQKQTPI